MSILDRSTRGLTAIVLLTGLAAPASASAVTTEQFHLRSGSDLVGLCSTPTDDPLYAAAIHFCHGFGAGVYQTIQALTARDEEGPLMCPPNPAPSRNEEVAKFLVWAKSHPERLSESPADVVGRFLIEQFPCPKRSK